MTRLFYPHSIVVKEGTLPILILVSAETGSYPRGPVDGWLSTEPAQPQHKVLLPTQGHVAGSYDIIHALPSDWTGLLCNWPATSFHKGEL